jgi:hypothetical protein
MFAGLESFLQLFGIHLPSATDAHTVSHVARSQLQLIGRITIDFIKFITSQTHQFGRKQFPF